jgi:hypothetical protein
LDIQAAKNWVKEESSARKVLPENVEKVFGKNVTETSLAQMQKAFILSQDQKYLFVDDDYNHWEYSGSDHCWKGQFFNSLQYMDKKQLSV